MSEKEKDTAVNTETKNTEETPVESSRAEQNKKVQEALSAMAEGKGVFHLNTPIVSGDESIEDLPYDFTKLSGLEYTQAMDSDSRSTNMTKISHRQALALFATAAAKNVERLDMTDIIERIGASDAIEAIELATIFFAGSMRAGRMRISKK